LKIELTQNGGTYIDFIQ